MSEEVAEVVVNESESQQSLSDGADVGVPSWPAEIESLLGELEQFEPRSVVNAERLGELRFVGADERLEEIRQTLRNLRREPSDEIPTGFFGELQANLNGLKNVVEQMMMLSPVGEPDVRPRRDSLQNEFNNYFQFIHDRVKPLCFTARVTALLDGLGYVRGADTRAVKDLSAQLDQMQERAAELENLAPLVEAQRQLLGESGVSKLSAFFEERADDHAKSFRWWALGLVATVFVVAAVAGVVVYATKPASDATNAQIVTHVFFDLLILGFAIFLLRFVAIQTRAHRHMHFVAKNKANALSTFNLIVAGQEADVRSNVALALAQAVFNSDDGIFSDASSDTVTIVERMGSAIARSPGS